MRKLIRSSMAASVLLAWSLPLVSSAATKPGKAKAYLVYIGTYTRGKSKGIYAYKFDPATGDLTPLGLEAETSNPSFVAVDPESRFLYAVNESGNNGAPTGMVTAYAMDAATGKLTKLNSVSSKGGGPCHLMVDKTGKTLVVANYGTGSAAAFPIQSDGQLGEATSVDQHSGSSADPARQKGPHAHCSLISPDNKYVIVNDLGLDKVFVYKLDAANSKLIPNDPPYGTVAPGSGPRHFAFDPKEKFGYAINEMKSTVTAFKFNPKTGALTEVQTVSTLAPDFKGETTTAEVFVSPNGKFLYGSNRGQDTISVFSIDRPTGKLTLIQNAPSGGKTPRGFAIDPTGHYLIAGNQDTDNLVVFKIDQKTGKLTPTGKTEEVGAPVNVVFVPMK